jgi:hypothetical protein
MTIPELLVHKMQASSGNEATFDVAFISQTPGAPASLITIVTRWTFAPTAADIGEARALICTIPAFKYEAESRNISAAMHYHATGSASDPGMN